MGCCAAPGRSIYHQIGLKDQDDIFECCTTSFRQLLGAVIGIVDSTLSSFIAQPCRFGEE